MSYSSFSVLNTNHENNVDPKEVTANVSGIGAELKVPLFVKLNSLKSEKNKKFVLNFLEATLRIVGVRSVEISIILPMSMDVESCSARIFYLNFPMSNRVIKSIEEGRHLDVNFELKLTYHISTYRIIPLNLLSINDRGGDGYIQLNTGLASSEIKWSIPQSNWVNKILPNLGYLGTQIIELPLISNNLQNIFPTSTKEFQRALTYFANGDYDNAVSYCRTTLEPLKNELPSLKNEIESNSEFEWHKKSVEASLSYLETLTKSTYSITSKVHHTPSFGHFNRKTTESIINITAGIIQFAAQFSKQSDKDS